MNVKWHQQHVLPRGAVLEQRVEWHREHQEQCACRPIPAGLRAQMSEAARAGAAPSAAETKFSNVVLAFADEPSVSYGGKGFGSRALKLGGQMFAMLTSQGEFVVRVSRARAEELVAQRRGQYFDPGHGRLMKEWLVLPAASTRWLEYAREAYTAAQDRRSRASSATRRPHSSEPPPRAAARTSTVQRSGARASTRKARAKSG